MNSALILVSLVFIYSGITVNSQTAQRWQLQGGPATSIEYASSTNGLYSSGKLLYIVDGDTGAGRLNTFYTLDLATPNWTTYTPSPAPSARCEHGLAWYQSKLFLYSGLDSTYTTDVWIGNGTSWTKQNCTYQGRQGTVCTSTSSTVYCFGGNPSSLVKQNDLWAYNSSYSCMTQIANNAVNSPAPSRFGVVVALNETTLFFFGGDTTDQNVHFYNINTKLWSTVSTFSNTSVASPTMPSNFLQYGCEDGDTVWIYASAITPTTIYSYKVSTKTWSKYSGSVSLLNGRANVYYPDIRTGPVGGLYKGLFYIWGGSLNGDSTGNTSPGLMSVYVFSTMELRWVSAYISGVNVSNSSDNNSIIFQFSGWGFASSLSTVSEINQVTINNSTTACNVTTSPTTTSAFSNFSCTLPRACTFQNVTLLTVNIVRDIYFVPMEVVSWSFPTGIPVNALPNSSCISTTSTIATLTSTTVQPASSQNVNQASEASAPLSSTAAGAIAAGFGIAFIGSAATIVLYRKQQIKYREMLSRKKKMANVTAASLMAYMQDTTQTSARSITKSKTLDGEGFNNRTLFNATFMAGNGFSIPGHLRLEASDLRIIGDIAEGGGGSIKMAEMLRPLESNEEKFENSRVAIKILKPTDDSPTSGIETKAIWQKEIGIMWALNQHPNIVKLIGFTDDQWIVMPLYPSNLANVIYNINIPLSPDQCFDLVHDIVCGMAALHSIGVVHLDLKPLNVLLNLDSVEQTFQAKICDFGISRIMNQRTYIQGVLKSKAIGITPRYASPEAFVMVSTSGMSDNTPPATPSMDVFSFAVIVWELLERAPAWADKPPEEISNVILSGQRLEISSSILDSKNDIIRLLSSIMIASWASDPEERPTFLQIDDRLRLSLS